MQRAERAGIAFAAITVLTWGMAGVWIRMLPFPPLFINGGRLLIGLAGLLPLVLLQRSRRDALRPALRNRWSWLLALALVAYYTLSVFAFQFGTVAEVALFIGSSPAFVLVTRVVRRLPISTREKVGAAVAFAGILIVLGPKIIGTSHDTTRRLIGDLLALAAACTSAIYASTFRFVHEDARHDAPDAMSVALMAMLFGGAALTGIGLALHSATIGVKFSNFVVLIFLTLGLLSTAVPSVTYAAASRRLPAIITTTSQLMIPVVSTIGAAVLLKEFPPITVYIGAALIMYGILHMFGGERGPEEVPAID